MTKTIKIWAVIFSILSVLTNLISLYLVFFLAPIEAQMGAVQKVFYYHVPFAVSSYILLFVSFVFSILFLATKKEKYDIWAYAGAEVGLVFILLVLVSGTVWGRSAWGKWWVWEPRLTTFLIIFLIYFSYILIRVLGKNDQRTPKIASVLSIIGFLDVPLVNRAIYWWGSVVHPQKITLEPQMKMIFIFVFFSVTAFSLTFLFWRVLIDKRISLKDG
ncbi:MAG: cytochrome c biogenesis protein [Acidobacteria bacterium]|nr:cytochrome c biogenesis protein [Acidobacteriota bacterium]